MGENDEQFPIEKVIPSSSEIDKRSMSLIIELRTQLLNESFWVNNIYKKSQLGGANNIKNKTIPFFGRRLWWSQPVRHFIFCKAGKGTLPWEQRAKIKNHRWVTKKLMGLANYLAWVCPTIITNIRRIERNTDHKKLRFHPAINHT